MEEQIAVTELSSAEQELAELRGFPPITWPRFGKVLPEPLNVDDVDIDRLPSVLAARHVCEAAEQDGYVERLIGSIRRERLDHMIILGEGHVRWLMRAYVYYYNTARTLLSLSKDAPTDAQSNHVAPSTPSGTLLVCATNTVGFSFW